MQTQPKLGQELNRKKHTLTAKIFSIQFAQFSIEMRAELLKETKMAIVYKMIAILQTAIQN